MRPPMVIGFDVETSDWDDNTSFARQEGHFKTGFPCSENRTSAFGHVCAIGYAVFRRKDNESNICLAETPVEVPIVLTENESIEKKAWSVHGITSGDCENGQRFEVVMQPLLALLRQGAVIMAHNLAHEALVLCREAQKQSVLSKGDASMLMRSLYNGHCTSILAGTRNNGLFRNLLDEFRICFGDGAGASLRDHCPGNDAAKSARIFLHHNDAVVIDATLVSEPVDEPCLKKPCLG